MRLSVSGAVVKACVASHARVKQHMVCSETMRRCVCVRACVHDGGVLCSPVIWSPFKVQNIPHGRKKYASVCARVCVFCGLAMQLT